MPKTDHDMNDKDHLREIIEVISGELELRSLLTIIVQKACELLRADRGSIGLVNSAEDVVRIEAVYKMPAEELGAVARRGEGLAGRVYQDCAPVLLERYGDAQARPLKGMDEDSVVGMPIMWRGEIIGTFGIGAGPPKRFGDNDMHMLELFARHAAIAINNARSYEHEKHYAALKERQRLARELHDNISQLLFSMTLVAQSLAPGFKVSEEEGEARVARVLEIAGLVQQEMKSLLAELRGPTDDKNSMAAYARRTPLSKVLKRYCALAVPSEIETVFSIDEEIALEGVRRETLLRITQEAIANAVRHGAAKSITFSLGAESNAHIFRIENDGRRLGDAVPASSASTHIGLESMRERAVAAGGVLTMEDRAEGGVCVEVRFAFT